ncbi:MAG: type II toxin-antitoxin system VapB family antitoxin [Actinomycetales bacterium]|nr:type II toxin-antitoxin system VapB family antitoxin [Actinomycetales bacterium]
MLNIKDPEAHRLAAELAAVEGTTMTGAVTQALRDALAERHRQHTVTEDVLRGLIATARSSQAPADGDVFADLYDEHTGLPR